VGVGDGEMVFTVRAGRAEAARPLTLAEAGFRERSDLQEWIRVHPRILGAGVRIVTMEFDRWASVSATHADRLDLLGLDEEGRLVLAELKRDGAPDFVEMQAIKYAAYASRFTLDTLAACHGSYLRKTDPSVTDEDALAQLTEHCGGLDDAVLSSPRIVLVAGSFPESVTASVVWLCNQGLDITLVQVRAYRAEHDTVISVSQIWPLREVDELVIGPSLPRPSRHRDQRTHRSRSAIAQLVESGVVSDGTEMQFVPSGSESRAVAAWLSKHPERGRATWRAGERVNVLEWAVDGRRYSTSNLAAIIVKEATGAVLTPAGPSWWALEDGTTLSELAGFGTGRRDWSELHALMRQVRSGEWTTYGDLAHAVGSHPIAVGQHIARCDECENAWRVLGSDGRPRPNFEWADPECQDTVRDVLTAEDVQFLDTGQANAAQRVTEAVLASRVSPR
jgi:alkylated DNA nucleotide flippase Atl1